MKSALEKIVGPKIINAVWSAIQPFIIEIKNHKVVVKNLHIVFKLKDTATDNFVQTYRFNGSKVLNVIRYVQICKRGFRKVIKEENTVALFVIVKLRKLA